jgi:lipopolysaccharide export system permease protein
MKTLTRYIGREVLGAVLFIFAGLVMLFAFFDLIRELGDVGRGGYTISGALLYIALQLPSRMYELFPVAALIGTLFALANLVSNSEYTVMRASGASVAQVTWALMRVGVPLAVVTFLAGELVAPPAERLSQAVRAAAKGDAPRFRAKEFDSGFWFRQAQSVVNIRGVLPDLTLVGIRIYEFDEQSRLAAMRTAESATFAGNGKLRLANVRITRVSSTEVRTTQTDSAMWNTLLRPSLLTVYQVPPERLELGTLWENMRVLGASADALPDRVLEQDLLPGRRAGDDGARAAVRLSAAPRRRHRLPHIRGNDARTRVLPRRPRVHQPRHAE